MGKLDGIIGGAIGAEALVLLKGYLDKHGGIDGVRAEFEKSGFGQQVKSWIDHGPNMPISVEDVHKALGSEKIKQLAESTGLPVDKLAKYMSDHLPSYVDESTPEGKIPPRG